MRIVNTITETEMLTVVKINIGVKVLNSNFTRIIIYRTFVYFIYVCLSFKYFGKLLNEF